MMAGPDRDDPKHPRTLRLLIARLEVGHQRRNELEGRTDVIADLHIPVAQSPGDQRLLFPLGGRGHAQARRQRRIESKMQFAKKCRGKR